MVRPLPSGGHVKVEDKGRGNMNDATRRRENQPDGGDERNDSPALLGRTVQIKGAGSLNLHACTSEADWTLQPGKSNVAGSQVQSIHTVNVINVSCVRRRANAAGEARNSPCGVESWKHTRELHEQQTMEKKE